MHSLLRVIHYCFCQLVKSMSRVPAATIYLSHPLIITLGHVQGKRMIGEQDLRVYLDKWDKKYWATYKVLDILQKVFYRSVCLIRNIKSLRCLVLEPLAPSICHELSSHIRLLCILYTYRVGFRSYESIHQHLFKQGCAAKVGLLCAE